MKPDVIVTAPGEKISENKYPGARIVDGASEEGKALSSMAGNNVGISYYGSSALRIKGIDSSDSLSDPGEMDISHGIKQVSRTVILNDDLEEVRSGKIEEEKNYSSQSETEQNESEPEKTTELKPKQPGQLISREDVLSVIKARVRKRIAEESKRKEK